MTAHETDTPWTGGPVPVVVHNADALRPVPVPSAGEPQGVTATTLVLTAQDPVQQLLPVDPLRCEAIVIQAGDNDFVICHSKADAQAAANSTAALPNPSGAIVLKTMLCPVMIRTQARLFVTAQAFPTRVSLIITRRGT